MKAEERHELKENDLGSWLQYGLPIWLKQNGSYLLLIAALGFLGFQVWRLYEARQEGTRIKAWNELRMAQQSADVPSALKTLIETYDLPDVREQAYLDLGDAYMQLQPFPGQLKSMNLSRSDVLTEAYNAYQKLLTLYGASDDLIAGKAMLGMAGVQEDRGEWDQAKKIYEQMTDKGGRFAGTATAVAAEAKLKTLDARRNAPRLTSEIKIAPPTMPSTSTGLSPGALPGAFGTMPGMALEPSKTAPASAPASPAGLPGAGLPFGPGALSPTTTPSGTTAPAGAATMPR